MAPSWPWNSAKLPLERRFGRPNGVKLALERRFGQGAAAKGPRGPPTHCNPEGMVRPGGVRSYENIRIDIGARPSYDLFFDA